MRGSRPAWRSKPRAVHDPGKILLDVALAVPQNADCLADVGILWDESGVFGPVGLRSDGFPSRRRSRRVWAEGPHGDPQRTF